MSPDYFTPEELAALKKFAQRQIKRDERVKEFADENGPLDERTVELLSDIVR